MAGQKNWVSEVMGGVYDETIGIPEEDVFAIVRDRNLRRPLERFFYEGGVAPDIELRPDSGLTRGNFTSLDRTKQKIIVEIVSSVLFQSWPTRSWITR